MRRVLARTMGKYGKPLAIRCDNGPELNSRHFLAWAIENKIDILHIRPGKPTQNALRVPLQNLTCRTGTV